MEIYRMKSGYHMTGKPDNLYLHRYLWEKFNDRRIPIGYQIHHKDGDKGNNAKDNLVILSSKEHLCVHYADKVGELMKAWHKSEKGREWHRERALNFFQKRPYVEKTCLYRNCQKKYATKGTYSKYCSNNCLQMEFYYKNK